MRIGNSRFWIPDASSIGQFPWAKTEAQVSPGFAKADATKASSSTQVLPPAASFSRSVSGRELLAVMLAETMPEVSMMQWSSSTSTLTSDRSNATSAGLSVFMFAQVEYRLKKLSMSAEGGGGEAPPKPKHCSANGMNVVAHGALHCQGTASPSRQTLMPCCEQHASFTSSTQLSSCVSAVGAAQVCAADAVSDAVC